MCSFFVTLFSFAVKCFRACDPVVWHELSFEDEQYTSVYYQQLPRYSTMLQFLAEAIVFSCK